MRQVTLDAKGTEGTIGVDQLGAGYLYAMRIVHDAEGRQISVPQIWRTTDKGENWDDITPRAGSPGTRAATLDPYLYVDPLTSRLFINDLYLGCTHLSWSDDQGDTWTTNPAACGLPMNDHQTLFAGKPAAGTKTSGYESVVYLCSNQFVAGAIVSTITCARSIDGGATFEPGVVVATSTEGDERFRPYPKCGGMGHGHGRASPVDGTVFLPRVYCDEARVHISRDSGQTWTEVIVDKTVGSVPEGNENHEARVAIDRNGNVYMYWIAADRLPVLSVSRDGGDTWSLPRRVSAPDITAARFPAIVAGDAGKIAFLYYGTTDPQQGETDELATWNAYVGFAYDAVDPSSAITTAMVNPADDPVARGSCHAGCGVGDFLDITMDPNTGEVWAAISDPCFDTCAGPDGGPGSPHSVAAIGLQVGGAPLIGST